MCRTWDFMKVSSNGTQHSPSIRTNITARPPVPPPALKTPTAKLAKLSELPRMTNRRRGSGGARQLRLWTPLYAGERWLLVSGLLNFRPPRLRSPKLSNFELLDSCMRRSAQDSFPRFFTGLPHEVVWGAHLRALCKASKHAVFCESARSPLLLNSLGKAGPQSRFLLLLLDLLLRGRKGGSFYVMGEINIRAKRPNAREVDSALR